MSIACLETGKTRDQSPSARRIRRCVLVGDTCYSIRFGDSFCKEPLRFERISEPRASNETVGSRTFQMGLVEYFACGHRGWMRVR